jgi:hypothetical protein
MSELNGMEGKKGEIFARKKETGKIVEENDFEGNFLEDENLGNEGSERGSEKGIAMDLILIDGLSDEFLYFEKKVCFF